jgi:hypothetical protein
MPGHQVDESTAPGVAVATDGNGRYTRLIHLPVPSSRQPRLTQRRSERRAPVAVELP